MKPEPLIECVPNFSEGRDLKKIREITEAIESVPEVQLLDVDAGRDANRTVVTFVGPPAAVTEAAFRAIHRASEVIDMRHQRGAHPRMGATDVCPLIPISNIEMDEVVDLAQRLAARVGSELHIPVYLYEEAATTPGRRNLAFLRAGEYEGLTGKLKDTAWKPDFGPCQIHARAGATVIGARHFLIAFNVNLNTTSVRLANAVAFDVRERGRLKRVEGKVVTDEAGQPVRIPGECPSVKALGWYMEEYGIAQVSMNLTNIDQTPLHIAFEACRRRAAARGLRVTGSELVGMAPLRVFTEAGRYFLQKQSQPADMPEEELIRVAVRSLGLNELRPFDPEHKIIEYRMRGLA